MTIKKDLSKTNPKLIIEFTESDLNDLLSENIFKWTFTTDGGQDIDVLLKLKGYEEAEVIEDDEDLPDAVYEDQF